MKTSIRLLFLVALLVVCGCSRPRYTPSVFPDPHNQPKLEIRGPTTHDQARARTWAFMELRRHGANADYVIYRDLYWNDRYGMEMARDKLK
jgi:hypothetical protein